ncbi:MAG: PAS domain-containing protein [Pseudomonadota bacterium]
MTHGIAAIEDVMMNSEVALTLARANDAEQALVLANPAFCLLTGFTMSEAVGQNCRFLQRGLDNHGARSEIRDALENGRDVQLLLKNRRASGEVFENLLMLYTLHDEDGTPRFFLGSQFDVTRGTVESLDQYGNALDRSIAWAMESRSRIKIRTTRILSESIVQAVRARLENEWTGGSGGQ